MALLNRKDVDKVSFAAAVGACGRAKHWSAALLLLKEAEAMSVDVSWPRFEKTNPGGEKRLQNFMQKDQEMKHVVQILYKDVSGMSSYDKIWMKIRRGSETSPPESSNLITPWVYLWARPRWACTMLRWRF